MDRLETRRERGHVFLGRKPTFRIVVATKGHANSFENQRHSVIRHALWSKWIGANSGLFDETACIDLLSASPNLQGLGFPERYWVHCCGYGREKMLAALGTSPSSSHPTVNNNRLILFHGEARSMKKQMRKARLTS